MNQIKMILGKSPLLLGVIDFKLYYSQKSTCFREENRRTLTFGGTLQASVREEFYLAGETDHRGCIGLKSVPIILKTMRNFYPIRADNPIF